jgi:hypothetical protein
MIHPDFCLMEDFAFAFPIPIPRAQILRSAKDGNFVPCIRSSFKSPPTWSKRLVLDWFSTKYGEASPSLIADLERKLFGTPAKPKSKARRNG